MKSPFTSRLDGATGAVTLVARGCVDAWALEAAAYLMTGEAYVALGTTNVWLRPKDTTRDKTSEALVARFAQLYAEQKDFWRQMRAKKTVRAGILQEALALVPPASRSVEDAFGELSPERKAEIAALLAEPRVEDEFGVARTWMETRKK